MQLHCDNDGSIRRFTNYATHESRRLYLRDAPHGHTETTHANEIAVLMNPFLVLGVCVGLSATGMLLGATVGVLAPEGSRLGAATDGFARGAVPCLVVLRIMPHLIGHVGFGAVALSVLGYGLFALLERGHHRAPSGLAASAVVVAFAGHSLVDGITMTLALPTGSIRLGDLVLAAALVGHRIPEGLIVGRSLSSHLGARGTMLVAAALALATTAGAAGAQALGASVEHRPLQIATAIAMGMLVRVIVHRPVVERGRVSGAMQLLGATLGCCAALFDR
jgi:hypothetical protein